MEEWLTYTYIYDRPPGTRGIYISARPRQGSRSIDTITQDCAASWPMGRGYPAVLYTTVLIFTEAYTMNVLSSH